MSSALRRRGSDYVSSYSYDEIMSGTGIVLLYGARGGAGQEAILTPESTIEAQPASSGVAVSGGGTSSNFLDIDFDVLLNKQTTLRGVTIVNFSVHNSANSNDIYGTVYLRKWDGSTETEIVSDQSGTLNLGVESKTFTSYLNIPDTLFKAGDYVRITVMLTTTSSNSATISLAHDPSDSATISGWTAGISKQLRFPMPTKIVE